MFKNFFDIWRIVEVVKKASENILQIANQKHINAAVNATKNHFRTILLLYIYIAYTNRPFTVFEELVDLQIANGVDMERVLHSSAVTGQT